nr:MAG TPA: hypothetical protein [Caudoviricetes sp.]
MNRFKCNTKIIMTCRYKNYSNLCHNFKRYSSKSLFKFIKS